MKYVLLCLLYGMISVNTIAQPNVTYPWDAPNQPGINKSEATGLEATAYPNPVTSSVSIDLNMRKPAMVRLKITDLIGKEVYHTNLQLYNAGSHTLNIPMATTSPGIYFFNVVDEAGYTTASGRFVKQ